MQSQSSTKIPRRAVSVNANSQTRYRFLSRCEMRETKNASGLCPYRSSGLVVRRAEYWRRRGIDPTAQAGLTLQELTESHCRPSPLRAYAFANVNIIHRTSLFVLRPVEHRLNIKFLSLLL